MAEEPRGWKIPGIAQSVQPHRRRAAWQEPELEYDGTEPPRVWLERLKQLKQIHGYNDRETLRIAERCLKGTAQLWFRLHQPASFDSLRTGLHTRFAPGPIQNPRPAPQQPSGSTTAASVSSPSFLKPAFSPPSQSSATATATAASPFLAKSRSKSHLEPRHGEGAPSDVPTRPAIHRAHLEVVDTPMPSDAGPKSCRSIAGANPRKPGGGQGRSSVCNGGSGAGVSSVQRVEFSRRESGSGSVSHKSSVRLDARRSPELETSAGLGDESRDRGARSMDNISLSSMSHSISAKDVMAENGLRRLPPSCKGLPINWQEALLRFKHAIHNAMKGDWRQLSPDFCKFYLQCYGLRTSGTRREQIYRIRDHLELMDGSGAHKYPRSSFSIDCSEVARGVSYDIHLHQQMFDLLNCNVIDNVRRTVVGRVVKDSKSSTTREQVFTIEVYWSRGPHAFRPMRPVCIKALDLYLLKPHRQRWINEEARKGLLEERKKSKVEQTASTKFKVMFNFTHIGRLLFWLLPRSEDRLHVRVQFLAPEMNFCEGMLEES